MMRSSQIHSAFINRLTGSFPDSLDHFYPDARRIFPDLPIRVHVATAVTLEERLVRHLRMSWKNERNTFGFDIVDEDYSAVESYLRRAFKNKASMYVSDVADALGLEYAIVREIIAQMIKQGKLKTK